MSKNHGVDENSIETLNKLLERIQDIPKQMNYISKHVNTLVGDGNGWCSKAAISCKNVLDNQVSRTNNYCEEIEQYLERLSQKVSNSFDFDDTSTKTIENS